MATRKKTPAKKAPAKKAPVKKRRTKTVVCAEEDRWAPLKTFGLIMLGGLGAAGAGAALVRNGVSATTTGLVLGTAGLGVAVGAKGGLQAFGGGAAAAAGSQLALAWFAKRATTKKQKELASGKGAKGKGRSNNERGYPHVENVFARARRKVAEQAEYAQGERVEAAA